MRFERHLNRPTRPRHADGERGLLLGAADSASGIVVEGFEPCEALDAESLAAAAMRRKLNRASEGAGPEHNSSVVGFYRISPTPAGEFEPADIALIRAHFSAPLHVFLLATPGNDVPRLFLWRNRQLRPYERKLALLAAGDAQPGAGRTPRQIPAIAPPVAPPRRRNWLRSGLLIGAILLVACAAALGLRYLAASGPRTPAGTEGTPRTASLGLRVTTAGQDLRVSWNGRGAPLSSCRLAILTIADGTTRREITLSPSQIQDGSVMYRRESDTVQFRLDAIGERGVAGTEMVVAIGRAPARLPEPAAVPVPEPPPILPAAPAAGNAYVPPQPVSKASPTIPRGVTLPDEPINIAVRVSIDARGSVVNAESLADDSVPVALSDAAEQAATLWKFEPARRGDRAVPSRTTLRFRFAAP